MIRPRKNKLIHWFFHHYTGFIIKRHFQAFRFNEVAVDAGKSVLLLANHFGWWDGFIWYWLNHLLLKKRFHIMVLEDTVKNTFFFKYMGAFSIHKGSRQMLESLQYAAGLLNDPQNLVVVFPQGKLYSNFVDEVTAEQGIMRIIRPAAGKFQYLFGAAFIENFRHKKPTVHLYLKSSTANVATTEELQQAYQQHYNRAKLQQTQIIL